MSTNSVLKKTLTAHNYALDDFNSVHAEVAVLKHSHMLRSERKSKYLNLLVIRLSKSGYIGNSKPCFHCVQHLLNTNIKIKYVYYSTACGTIVRDKLSNLILSTYISSANRKKMFGLDNSEFDVYRPIFVNDLIKTYNYDCSLSMILSFFDTKSNSDSDSDSDSDNSSNISTLISAEETVFNNSNTIEIFSSGNKQ